MTAPSTLTDLRDRLKAVAEAGTPAWGRFNKLSKASGISTDSWKGMWYGRQRPTAEMVEFAARTWPEFAFWLTTGVTDQRHGHRAPDGADCYPEERLAPRREAAKYFRHAIEMASRRSTESQGQLADFATLRALAKKRADDEQAASAADVTEDDGQAVSTLVRAFERLDAKTPVKAPTLTGRVLADLQAGRGWSDEYMATLLGTDTDTFRAARTDTTKLRLLQIITIFDKWAYDQVRDAVLKVAPDDLAAELRARDIERGRRVLE